MLIAEATKVNMDGYERIPDVGTGGGVSSSLEPIYNTMLRCPLPPVSVTPDSLRQFYLKGQIPQHRLLPPAIVSTSSTTTTVSSSTSSTITGKTPVQNTNLQVGISTGIINPNQQFKGSVTMKPSFLVQKISVSAPARVRLYSTKLAQTNDAGRNTNTYPSSTNGSGIILDVEITSKQEWAVSPPAAGSNNDSPQTSVVYVTIDSLATSTTTIAVNIQYN
jgi:hypothetical protein